MKNRLSFKARIFRWGFKRWSNRLGRLLKFIEWIFKKQKYAKIPKFKFSKYNINKFLINDNLYYEIKSENNEHAFMYIHGGAFISQIKKPHWITIKRIINNTNANAYVPIYPLANPWYSPARDNIIFLTNVYKEMLKKYKSENITILGDSAGGSLTLILGQQLKLQGLPKPKNLITISPGVDLGETIEKEEETINLKKDEVLNEYMLIFAHKWYVKTGDNPKDPIYSPIYGDCKDIGKITMLLGEKELFVNQCRLFHKKLNEQDIKHNYIEHKDMFHIYPIFPLKESKEDFELIGKLIIN